MKWLNIICLLIVLTASVSFCGEYASRIDHSEPIFPVTGIYATKPQQAIEFKKPEKSVQQKTSQHRDYSMYSPWFETGTGTTSNRHLVQVHGANPQELVGMSQDQKNRMHGMFHGERPRTQFSYRSQATSGCPGGACPTGILGRRRR